MKRREETAKEEAKRPEAAVKSKAAGVSREKTINRTAPAVAVIFFLFVLVYLSRSLYAYVNASHTATEIVRIGSIDVPRVVSGVIIRDERVYYADRDGRLMFNVGEFERVKPTTLICSIQDVSAAAETRRDILDLDEAFSALQETRKDISSADPAISRINAQLKSITDAQLYQFSTLGMKEIYALKENLAQRIENRNTIILNDNLNVRDDLFIEQQRLANQLSSHESAIRADVSGIVSAYLDGYEETYTFENMKELTREQTLLKTGFNQINSSKEIKTDEPAFKIVHKNDWYIAAYMPNEIAAGFEEGDSRILFIETGDVFTPVAAIVYMINPGYRESFMLFKFTKNIIGYMGMRSVNFKTSDSVQSGFKIPVSAITERNYFAVPEEYVSEAENNNFFVSLKTYGETVVRVPVEITGTYPGGCHIFDRSGALKKGDFLILDQLSSDSFEIAETQSVLGVYKVESGIAEFRKIIYDEDVSGLSGYIILDMSLSQGIKAYDYIVTESSGAYEGQIIR
ncbi:MAG: hypothetical protein FWF03_02240 [Defluviitaleaceae bacterium]|nr:hypothetical protein [Defluviitaleaceae bacterium]